MRILSLCYEFPPVGGGASRVAHGLSRELVQLGHEVTVVTMGMKGLPARECIDGVDVHRVPGIRQHPYQCSVHEAAYHLLGATRTALRLAQERQFDINHTHFILPDGYTARQVARQTGLPYVITAHGSDVPGYDPHRLQLLHRLLAPKWRSIVNSASAVVSPSDGLSQLIKDRGARTEVLTIPNGLDIGQYHAHRQRSKQILVVAKMLQRKGIQYLVRALADSDLGYEVHIVGDGPYLPELKKLAEETGADVRFWGWLDNNSPELEELFENSRIFVLPSEAENFPIVLLEAMRAGLAIVTTRGTGCAEVVGDAAILVEPCSPEAIRAALDRLVADDGLRQSLGAAGRTRIESNFSWAAVATRYVRLYEQCLHRGAAGQSEADSDDALPSTRSP